MDIPSPCPYCQKPPKVLKSGATWRVACPRPHLTHVAVRPMKSRRRALGHWEMAVSELICNGAYTGVKQLADGRRCGLMRMLYTYALAANVSLLGHEYRYCFEHLEDAQASLQAWNGEGHPGGPWIACKGKGVDLLNPAYLAS